MQLTNSPEPPQCSPVSPESWKEAVGAEKLPGRCHQHSLAFPDHPSYKAVHPSYPHPTRAPTLLASSRKLKILFRHQLPEQGTASIEHLHVLAVDARGWWKLNLQWQRTAVKVPHLHFKKSTLIMKWSSENKGKNTLPQQTLPPVLLPAHVGSCRNCAQGTQGQPVPPGMCPSHRVQS